VTVKHIFWKDDTETFYLGWKSWIGKRSSLTNSLGRNVKSIGITFKSGFGDFEYSLNLFLVSLPSYIKRLSACALNFYLQINFLDARTWISHPWTNFYKSKDHNRHPDMPKKPLSMYMLYYSEKREQILADNPTLSMPEVAKICSEQYQVMFWFMTRISWEALILFLFY